jgi:hypothetical protein
MEDEEREIDIHDVEDFIEWEADRWDKERIARMCGYEDIDIEAVQKIEIKTLDDQYKFELVAKLFKTYGTSMELEAALGSELLKKIEYVVV